MAGSGREIPSAEEWQTMRATKARVRLLERDLRWKRRRARLCLAAVFLVVVCIPALIAWSAVARGSHDWLVAGNAVLGCLLGFSLLTLSVVGINHYEKKDTATATQRYKKSIAELQDALEGDQESLRTWNAVRPEPLLIRRRRYRETVAEVIERLQVESRKYRRIHNGLQSLIMVGSTTITTLAALDAKDWNWLTISVVVLGFSVTLASTFTGYYKYRERSYFLQQTADAIEEESNAFTLGVGEYSVFGSDQEEDQALAKFTQRVEVLRNEQRRRQQQLDQPAEHAPPQNASGPGG